MPAGTFQLDDNDFENYYDINGNGVVDAGDRFLQFIEFDDLNKISAPPSTTVINSDPETTGIAAFEVLSSETDSTETAIYDLAGGGFESRQVGGLELGKLQDGDTIFTFLDTLQAGLGTGLQTNVTSQGSSMGDPLGFIFSDSTDDISTSLQLANSTYGNLTELFNVTTSGDLEYTLDFDAGDGDRVGASGGFLLQLGGPALAAGQNLGNLGNSVVTIAEEFTPGFYLAQRGSRPDFRIISGTFASATGGVSGDGIAPTAGIQSNVTLQAVRVPSPSTGLLFGIGLIALGGVIRQQARRA
ncbi:hypothetical protein CKO28_11750 [Rhodovibrio sodomensis]|uniref:PEP-CTERM protein-sorting domain-containing protein n=1 Tax=Rhodovibrio sodomensis TaxID=1088 RepID=A0ABS1DF06_9PROT|nr:hypothetical protein [Rhodovibrio sodomensis]